MEKKRKFKSVLHEYNNMKNECQICFSLTQQNEK